MIVIVWHVLADEATYAELGADYFERRTNAEARMRYLGRGLKRLGQRIILQPGA